MRSARLNRLAYPLSDVSIRFSRAGMRTTLSMSSPLWNGSPEALLSPCTHIVISCSDLTEATLAGASISLVAAVTIVFLLLAVCTDQLSSISRWVGNVDLVSYVISAGYLHNMNVTSLFPTHSRPKCVLQELGSFLALETREELVVDRSAQGELLRINFNISYPSLSCEFATLDVSDALGTVRQCPSSVSSSRKGSSPESAYDRDNSFVHATISTMDVSLKCMTLAIVYVECGVGCCRSA